MYEEGENTRYIMNIQSFKVFQFRQFPATHLVSINILPALCKLSTQWYEYLLIFCGTS